MKHGERGLQGVRTIMHRETGRCAGLRCREHEKAYLDQNLWEHSRDVHTGEKIEFVYKVDKTFKEDVLGSWMRPSGLQGRRGPNLMKIMSG